MNVPISPCWYAGKYYQPWKMLLTCLLVLVLAFFFLKVFWFCGPARYSNSNVIQISHPTHGFSFPFFFSHSFFLTPIFRCTGGGIAKGTRGHNTKRAKADAAASGGIFLIFIFYFIFFRLHAYPACQPRCKEGSMGYFWSLGFGFLCCP